MISNQFYNSNNQNIHHFSSLSALNQEYESTDQLSTSDIFSLESIRSTLIRQEETIIFALIERAQYRRNNIIYTSTNNANFMDENGILYKLISQ